MSGNQFPSDVQFAGLIQAATAAADAQERNATILGKRGRNDDDDDSLIDTQLRGDPLEQQHTNGQLPPSTPILHNSASVLFREPSEKSKKYSRPPLGKVYTDLELAPESFLRLQNAAKLYMLDESKPERRDVVGHKKHSSHNDVAKLRLWNCVEDFLNTDNNGENWFGHSANAGVPDAPQRTFFWPQDKQKITKLCMPLFRKMVTNERQRLYASETRKQDSNKQAKTAIIDNTASQPVVGSPQLPETPDHASNIDHTLDTQHEITGMYSASNPQQQMIDNAGHVGTSISVIRVSDNDNGHRLMPQFSLSSERLPSLETVVNVARTRYEQTVTHLSSPAVNWLTPVVKVWLPSGLVRIKDDGQWMVALLSASMVDWMDSELKVLVDVSPASDEASN